MTDAAVREAYDSRAAEYIELFGDVSQMADADRDLIGRWRDSTPGSLLDAGCGPGHWTNFLHDGHRDVLGIDLSEAFLAAARERYPVLPFVQGTFRQLPTPTASVGGILAWYSIIHAPPDTLPTILNEFARCLVPTGSLLIGFFDGQAGKPFPHAVAPAHFWSVESLDVALSNAGFTVLARHQSQDSGHRPHAALTARLID